MIDPELQATLARIEGKIDNLNARQRTTYGLELQMAIDVTTLITSLNDNTNAVSARIDRLTAAIANQGNTVTPDQLTQLQAVSDHLKSLGQDPAAPVPAVPAVLTTT